MHTNYDCFEDELIESIAQPILEALLSLQDELADPYAESKISIVPHDFHPADLDPEEVFPMDLPAETDTEVRQVMINCDFDENLPGLSDDFLEKLQDYLQEKLDELSMPRVLH